MTNFEFCRDSIHIKTTESCLLLFLFTLVLMDNICSNGGMNEYTYTLLSCFSYHYEKDCMKFGQLSLDNQRCCSLARFPIRKELPAGVDP